MSRVTPSKRNSGNEQEMASLKEEVSVLREELKKKSEVIRQLSGNLLSERIVSLSPSPKSSRKNSPQKSPLKGPAQKCSESLELIALRKELKEKSELIRALESRIPSPLSTKSEELKRENYK